MNLDLTSLERIDDLQERFVLEERRVLGEVNVSVPLPVFRDLVKLARYGQSALEKKRRQRPPQELAAKRKHARQLMLDGIDTPTVVATTGLDANTVGGIRAQINRARTIA